MKNFLLLLVFIPAFLVSCGDTEDETTIYVGDWVKKGQLDGRARGGAVAFTINDIAYLVGGTYYSNKSYWLKDVWAYNPEKDKWYKKDDFTKGSIRTGAVAFSIGSKGYYGTGYSGNTGVDSSSYILLKDFYEFDPAKPEGSQWKKLADFGGSARKGAIGYSINGKGYIITGVDAEDKCLMDTWEFTPDAGEGAWHQVTDDSKFDGYKRKNGLSFTINNKVYVCTGTGDNNSAINDLLMFDPESNSWSTKNSIANTPDVTYDDTYTISRESACAFVINEKGYITCGSLGSFKTDTWEYNPATDLWTKKTSFEGAARKDAVSFSVKNRGFVATGFGGNSNYYDDTYEFLPDNEYKVNPL